MIKVIAGILIGVSVSKIGWLTASFAFVDLVVQVITYCQTKF